MLALIADFKFNKRMSLPVYHHIHLKNGSPEELLARLTPEMNLKNPVVFHLEGLELTQQSESIGMIENFFFTENISFEFPYPIYLISSLESSSTKMPLIKSQDLLPKFFLQKEGRMNVKETHLALKNKLLHQEIKNVDPKVFKENLQTYGLTHRLIYDMEKESSFYRHLLTQLKVKKRG